MDLKSLGEEIWREWAGGFWVKTLSSALATALQDNSSNKDDGESNSAISTDNDPDSFPVDTFTWKEFARLIFLTDALNELGYTKIEQTHILRGHRTGGHPNSKEAKRVKRGEDHALVLRRQALSEVTTDTSGKAFGIKVTIPTPGHPSAQPSDWIFFLHNIKSLPSNAATDMKLNLKKACSMLKNTKSSKLRIKRLPSPAAISRAIPSQSRAIPVPYLGHIDKCRAHSFPSREPYPCHTRAIPQGVQEQSRQDSPAPKRSRGFRQQLRRQCAVA